MGMDSEERKKGCCVRGIHSRGEKMMLTELVNTEERTCHHSKIAVEKFADLSRAYYYGVTTELMICLSDIIIWLHCLTIGHVISIAAAVTASLTTRTRSLIGERTQESAFATWSSQPECATHLIGCFFEHQSFLLTHLGNLGIGQFPCVALHQYLL